MRVFNLYKSGILRNILFFDNGFKYHSPLNVNTLEFESKKEIKEGDLEEYIKYYYLNLLEANNVINFIENGNFKEDKENIIGKQLYKKHSEEKYIYAGMNGKNPLDIIYAEKSIKGFVIASRDSTTVLIENGFESLAPLNYWQKEYKNEKLFKVKDLGRVDIVMSDGVKLASTLLLPDNHEKVPVILVRTPYNRNAKIFDYYNYVMRGFAVCVQDVRGRGDSDGEYIPKYNEISDGNDTINSIVKESWSNGIVGMMGASYLGCVQWSAAASGNKHLKALISIVTSGDAFTDLPRKGGTFASGVLAWAVSVKDKVHKKENMMRTDWDEIVKIRPIKDIPMKVFGENIRFWDLWCSHEKYDEFWTRCNWNSKKENINVPALIVSGWYDDNGQATTQAIEVASKYKDEDKKIILGAWMHNGNSARIINGIEFGENALRYDIDYIFIKWFDKKLKNIDNDIEKMPVVQYYAVGKNKWLTSKKWVPEYTKLAKYYIFSDGDAKTSKGNGKLSKEAPTKQSEDTYIFDPTNIAEHLIDMSENEICVPANYSEIEKRDDVLIYTSEPFQKDTTIVGDITVVFYAKSSAKDTDFVVRVTEADTQGRSIRLADGVLKAKFRNGFDKIELLTPNKIEEYKIRTTKIANTFKKGSRMRLQITSGAENYIFPNFNTGENMFEETTPIKATQTVISSSEYPSYVLVNEFEGDL